MDRTTTAPIGENDERRVMTEGVHDFLARHRDALVEELSGWIRLRSVAGLPERVPDVRRSANWLAGTLRDAGFPSVEVWDTEGGPAVYAQWCEAPGAPTVLVYSHHDVRAAKDDNWDQCPPFEPVVRDGTSTAAALPTRSIGGEAGYTVLERLWTRPALEVISVIAGDPIGAGRAAIPSVAAADLSIRIVAGQHARTVGEQLRRWVADTISDRFDYQLTVAEETGQEPYRTPDDLPAVEVLAQAMREGFRRPVGRMGNAGGGPAQLLTDVVGAPVLFFGTGLPEDHWHDSDERASIDVLLAGAATLALFWDRLIQV
ncbi:M20/M25/M40 family metallo-hydrolase [Paractinoplanes maris]|uniref:M20/M25/M40 family metallo-hydrolase n=1 Tax=Paractinoplanes maris TaxID=1734446 RepID=UPI002021591A|nr:M20/M25/M40 family metallo-hydrolase [Actinoplanes maris]